MIFVLFTLVGVTWAQQNINVTETTTGQACNTEKTSKTIENIVVEARDCMLSYFSLDDIKTRVEIGRNNDVLDIVSEEFCLVKRIVQRCVNRSLPVADGCFTENDRDSLRMLSDITRSVLNFVCYKNAEKINLFLMAGGIECIENNTIELEICAKKTVSDSNFSNLTFENVYRSLIDNVTVCETYNKLQECVFNVLQTCTEVVPSNTVDSLFDHIKSFTICDPAKNN